MLPKKAISIKDVLSNGKLRWRDPCVVEGIAEKAYKY
jgi:hypothetical protein